MVDDMWTIDCIYRRHPVTIMLVPVFSVNVFAMPFDLPIVNTEWEVFV